jgi:phosphoglucosamine mutase
MVNVPHAPGVRWQTHPGLQAAKESVERQLNGRGRVLIRASGTEPKLRLMVEAEDAALAEAGVQQLLAVNLTNV